MREHRWNWWRKSEDRDNKLHLVDGKRCLMGRAVGAYFQKMFKNKEEDGNDNIVSVDEEASVNPVDNNENIINEEAASLDKQVDSNANIIEDEIVTLDKQDTDKQVDSNVNIIEEDTAASSRVGLLKRMRRHLGRKKDTTPV